MADRFLGIAAPQPVLAVRRGDDDATKAAWFRRQMAQAASYRARLVEVFGADGVARMEARNGGPMAVRSHREFRAIPGTMMLDESED
jgi:hypothetical protein